MRIGIDGLHLFGNYSGVHTALAELIGALRSGFPQDGLVLYVPRDFKGPPAADGDPGLQVRRTFFPGRWRTVRTLWRNFRLQNRAYADQCDVIHGPTYALPALCSKPAVVTIHDVIALTHPLFCTPGSARIQRRLIPRSVQAARRVIVPSLATKEELLRNVKEARAECIDVIPWGVAPVFKPVPEERKKALRKEMGLPEAYVLYVGNLEPKKNVLNLIRGFMAAKLNRDLPHTLVLAGQMGWGLPTLEKDVRNVGAAEHVRFTGYVPAHQLPGLYALADLFVLPSLVEGFGMPVLEAMASGCPVLVSPDAALQEVAGSAAHVLRYDAAKPLQPLREAFEHFLLDHRRERDELIRRGLERARIFTWERTARLTHESYTKALE